MSHALGCSKDVLTSAAGVGERFLRAPRFEDEKEIFMNFVRDLRLKFSDDHSLLLYLFGLFQSYQLSQHFKNSEMKFISNLSLKRISKVRDSLENQLKQLVPTDNQTEPNSNITKLFLLSAFYPDIAFKMSKRNHYLLPGSISAELQKESMQYVESLESILSEALNSDANNVDFTKNERGHALVFEELFDAGHSLIVKSSLVDPIFSVLFADNVATLFKTLYVDNWIRITSEDSDSLKLLLEARNLWKLLTRKCLAFSNPQVYTKFQKLLAILANIWDSGRIVEIK